MLTGKNVLFKNTHISASTCQAGLLGTEYPMILSENRKSKRYRSIAKARINGIDYGEIVLKDLSITGCCLESTVNIDIKSGIRHKIEIIPEAAAGIGKFELVAEPIWINGDGYSTEFGFFITESPKGKLFQRYVDYLSWRSETGASV